MSFEGDIFVKNTYLYKSHSYFHWYLSPVPNKQWEQLMQSFSTSNHCLMSEAVSQYWILQVRNKIVFLHLDANKLFCYWMSEIKQRGLSRRQTMNVDKSRFYFERWKLLGHRVIRSNFTWSKLSFFSWLKVS